MTRHPLVAFFAIAHVYSWTVWAAIAWLVPDLTAEQGTFISAPGAFGPAIAALWVTGRLEGRGGLRALLRSLTRWRVKPRYYLVAILGPLLTASLAVVIHVLLGGSPPEIETIALGLNVPPEETGRLVVMFPVVFAILCLGGPLAEEPGWRGFAQPRLQELIPPARAGFVIGVIWALWHVPLFVLLPSGTGQIPAFAFFPIVTALGVISAWLYNRTGQSTLLALLFHAGVNTFWAYGLGTFRNDSQLMVCLVSLVVLLALAAYRSLPRTCTPGGPLSDLHNVSR